jgi:putative NADH-flavin reductase
MKIAVFGGTGRTGIHVVKKALAQGHEVVVLARTPEKLTVQDEKFSIVQGDVTDQSAVDQTVNGADAVISTLAPTLVGMQNIIASMKKAQIRRIVATSGAGVYRTGDEPPFSSKVISWIIKTFSKQAYEESLAIANALQDSGLEWTLVRAPRLVDKPASNQLYIGPLNKNMKTTLAREDYAKFLVTAVNDDDLIGQSPVLSDK